MKQNGYEIKGRFNVMAQFEISVDTNGWNFTVIYGHHASGGYCCIPDWDIGCEMGPPENVAYNASKLRSAIRNQVDDISKRAVIAASLDLAIAIKDFAKQLEENRAMPIEKTITEMIREQLARERATLKDESVGFGVRE